MKRPWRRRLARLLAVLVTVVVAAPLGCRAASAWREHGTGHDLAPHEGRFVETPAGALFV